jgi:hypothetical protein
MIKPLSLVMAIFLATSFGSNVFAQKSKYPLMEEIAQSVVQKYQSATCRDLQRHVTKEPTGQEAEFREAAIRLLENNAEMRKEFINRVAAPIVNKLFECGMIP